MNDKVTQHLKKILGDEYTVEFQLEIEASILNTNISTLKSKIKELTGMTEYQIWKLTATEEQIERKKQVLKNYYETHKEDYKEKYYPKVKEYQEKNKEKLQEYRHQYYKEYLKTYVRPEPSEEQKERTRQRDLKYKRDYYQRNKEKIKARTRQYYQKKKGEQKSQSTD